MTALPDGRLASGSQDKTVRIWDLGGGACVRVLKGHKSVREGDGLALILYDAFIVC